MSASLLEHKPELEMNLFNLINSFTKFKIYKLFPFCNLPEF